MESVIDRVFTLLEYEKRTMQWLSEVTEIPVRRLYDMKKRQVMRTSEMEAIQKEYPEYAVWLSTGIEIPEAGHVSPMTKRAQRASGQ